MNHFDLSDSNSKGGEKVKRFLVLGLFVIFCLSLIGHASAQDDVNKHPACKYCGMDREKFAHSRFFVEFEDGSSLGTCSLHCTAIDFALNIDKAYRTMQVGDYNTKMLIDAEKTFWVIGGNKPGVMTKRAKWAFGSKGDAEKFMAANGGNLATFEQAFKAAYEDMYADTKMIQERRKMRRMQEKKQ
jgi:copper chaperone NosL